jgi:hypothetical protein
MGAGPLPLGTGVMNLARSATAGYSPSPRLPGLQPKLGAVESMARDFHLVAGAIDLHTIGSYETVSNVQIARSFTAA